MVEGKTHGGIILAPQQQYSIGQQLTGLLKLVAANSSEAMIIGLWTNSKILRN
ncbi:MAG: hypothetical protein AAGE96_23000 [Cyanobacteria bacterium P01_G01_bin.19]